MPGRGIQHLDLVATTVDRSLAFYMDLLWPSDVGLEHAGLRGGAA